MSLAILFFNTNPLWTSILAAFFINEKFTLKNLVILLACVFGVMLVVKPKFLFSENEAEKLNFIGCLFGLISAFAASIVTVILRDLGN